MEPDRVLVAVEAQLTCPEFKARLLAMMARAGLYRPPRSSLIQYRTEAAIRLMAGASRPEARDALQQRFGISRRGAYRLIERALNARQGRLFE